MSTETASSILKAVFAASLQGAAVILLLVALRPWLVRTVPARWRSALWLLALARLLIPSFVLPPRPLHLQNIPMFDRPDEDLILVLDKMHADGPAGETPAAGGAGPSAPAALTDPRATHPPVRFPEFSWWSMGLVMWGTGTLALAAWMFIGHRRLRRRLRKCGRPVEGLVAEVWAKTCGQMAARRPPRVLVTGAVDSPALVGAFAPVLLLPASALDRFTAEDWEHVFLHELAHYRRRDHWVQALQLIALCLHWFNPLVWWGLRCQRSDRESAADEMALLHLPAGGATGYGGTLLKVLSAHAATGFEPGMVGIMEDVGDLKQRLRAIVAFGPRRLFGSAMGVLLLLGLAVVVLGRASGAVKPLELVALAGQSEDRSPPDANGSGSGAGQELRVHLPAERGQILDRNGGILATNRVVQSLGLMLPQAPMPEADAVAFVRARVDAVGNLLSHPVGYPSEATILGQVKNRAVLPLDILSDLTEEQQAMVKALGRSEWVIHPLPLRFYPAGELGAHYLGYTGRSAARTGDAGIEGREGLELALDGELRGQPGSKTMAWDAVSGRTTEKGIEAPVPGRNAITTIDAQLQTWCEAAGREYAARGAMAVLDPNTGEVLAMASWPSYDPNRFTPSVTVAYFQSLNEDAGQPLVDRVTRALYPPGGIFKIFSGLAALESGAVKLDEKISNPPAIQLGGHPFRDWNNADRGELTFSEALAQNGDTWFYQAGMRTGAQPILDWAAKFGFGRKTGISLPEIGGVLPTEEYLRKTLGKTWKDAGDAGLANLAVGQGYLSATPLGVAHAMATLANGGDVYELHLVKQLQEASGRAVGEYLPKREARLAIRPEVLDAIRKAMVVRANGEGGPAAVEGVAVAGQSASAQGVRGGKKVTYGWFAGFAPADRPQYAFACVCEGDEVREAVAGTTAAPIVGKVLRQMFASHK